MITMARYLGPVGLASLLVLAGSSAQAQVPPTASEISQYAGLHQAAANGDINEILAALAKDQNPDPRDANQRTPLHVAAYLGRHDAMRALAKAKADVNALEYQAYDIVTIVTIAAVANDVPTLKVALEVGGKASNITSPYDGTALIAAAHLGHDEVVGMLIEAGAPLDHVNNLGWTALIEAVILGDGGPRHVNVVKALVQAGANVKIADRSGMTPLDHAKQRGYAEMVTILSTARAN
jgi:uncharacterized protein